MLAVKRERKSERENLTKLFERARLLGYVRLNARGKTRTTEHAGDKNKLN